MHLFSRAWIFVSHSTKDLEKVRPVRNALELEGAEPVLFFLKCLTDHDELDELIKREIEARNFFLLCESSNAKRSQWVKDEVDYVKSLEGKKIEEIDLEADWEMQLKGIIAILGHATIFLSYSSKDRNAVAPIRSGLADNDFSVWDAPQDISVGENWAEAISSAIEEAAQFGYFLHFISRDSLASTWVKHEVDRAMSLDVGNRYIPILLDQPVSLLEMLPRFVHERQRIDYSDRDSTKALQRLFEILGMKYT